MPPKRRDYGKEYRARKRSSGVPARVAAGHGPISKEIAQKLEAGTLTPAERRANRAGIRQYEQSYGPPGTRAGRRHDLVRRFKSREDALGWAEEEGIPEDYLRIRKTKAGWKVTLLR